MVAFSRPLPGAPRRDHAAARRLAGRPPGGATARARAARPPATAAPPPRRPTASGEMLRLRGEFAAAEDGLPPRRAAAGFEPQPGLALLRLAQGDVDGAAAPRSAASLSETTDPATRARLLPGRASRSCSPSATWARHARRATSSTRSRRGPTQRRAARAMADHARGAVAARGGRRARRARRAAPALERWHDLDAPYEAARVRVLIALACRALGDEDAAALELDAAARAVRGARREPDVARVDALVRRRRRRRPRADRRASSRCCAWSPPARRTGRSPPSSSSASGRSTATSATSSPSSGVASRSAATAYAYEHDLV